MTDSRITDNSIIDNNHKPLLHDDVNKRLLANIFHSLMGLAALIGLGVIDTWFISQLGVTALSVMGYVGPIALMASSALIGAEMATTVNIAKAAAKADSKKVANKDEIALACLSFATITSTLVTIITIAASPWVFALMGASDEVITYGLTYFQLLFLGLPLMAICMAGSGLMRGTGQPKKSARLFLALTIINLILDPLLIFGTVDYIGVGFTGFGILGAAIASIIAKGICAWLFFRLIRQSFNIQSFTTMSLSEHMVIWKTLVKLASTIAFNRLLIPLGVTIATAMIAYHGDKIVAAFGLTNTLLLLSTSFVLAINGALVPFISQNITAGNLERTQQGIRYCLLLNIIWGIVQGAVFWLFKDIIITGFTQDKAVFDLMILCLSIVPISNIGVGLFLINNALCYSLQKPKQVLILNLSRCFVIYLPSVWLCGYLWGANGVFIGLMTANVVMGLVASVHIKMQYTHLPQPINS